MRDVAIALVVFREVGVEEEEPYMADAGLPDLRDQLAPGKRDLDLQLGAVFPDRLDRKVVEIRVVVFRALAPIAVDRLREIALPIEQAHGDERNLEVSCRLAMVARQDAEAARIRGQALVHAELGAEVGDEILRAK